MGITSTHCCWLGSALSTVAQLGTRFMTYYLLIAWPLSILFRLLSDLSWICRNSVFKNRDLLWFLTIAETQLLQWLWNYRNQELPKLGINNAGEYGLIKQRIVQTKIYLRSMRGRLLGQPCLDITAKKNEQVIRKEP